MKAETDREFRAWVRTHGIEVLNVAGNRESKSPGIHDTVKTFLLRVLSPKRYEVEEERLSYEHGTEPLPIAAEKPRDYRRTRLGHKPGV